ncbi:hypothetical protein [Metasolibacillus fluoroglycofenilyticus]|uniref:hypothetical protein n=1 Tax=Metasolibacillus fluoroglycofenilyticus TaxID=1239396 RepID=UPI000D3DC7DA|nr:hypothetical protein [Metasolibacillus fluoroglycofenilyticus]
MLNILKKILKKISEKKCGNCGGILQKDNYGKIDLEDFKLINYDKAIKKFIESSRPSFSIEVLICETCQMTLEQVENKRITQRQKEEEEQRYLDALRKQVELKALEKQAIELGINIEKL